MPFTEPPFDSRRYRDIVTEALARIPVHNPEWTSQLDSDPGVTLLQLFAFMTESIIYRANRIPERNRMKFLRLLGIPLQPASVATGLVAFSKPRGDLTPVVLAADQELRASSVPFRTGNGLAVLPVEARLYYKSPLSEERKAEMEETYRRLYASFETAQKTLDFYETRSFELPEAGAALPVLDLLADTRDGAAWLALLARPGDDPEVARNAIANQVLTLGVVPALDETGCVLYPLGPSPGDERPRLIFEVPNTANEAVAAYEPLPFRAQSDPLERPAVVELDLPGPEGLRYWNNLDPLEAGTGRFPPSLEETDDGERLVSWIRIRARGPATEGGAHQLKVALSWVGINAATVEQRACVRAERLADGTGDPDQSATLVQTPVLPGSLTLTVNGEVWTETDDLAAAPPEVPPKSPRLSSASVDAPRAEDPASHVYTLDLESGEVRFGDGARGARPPFGATIQASYCHGGGREGLVGTGAIKRGPQGVEVVNPIPTWGGAAGETLEEAERRVPGFLRHRDRVMSKEDYEEIAGATPGVEMGRVEVLPLFHPSRPSQNWPGAVTVMVIPLRDLEQPEAPRPDQLFLETVCRHLEPRRIVTTELHIRGPEYKSLWVSVGVDVVKGRAAAPVREAVSAEIQRFLSPLTGGFEGDGWPRSKAVEALELWAAAARVEGVTKVNDLLLAGPNGGQAERVEMTGLELPWLRAVAVESGDPLSLGELLGEPEADPDAEEGLEVVPVPVVPKEC